MKSLVFDIETDGITDVSVIWCISAVDLDSNAVYEFGPSQIDEGRQATTSRLTSLSVITLLTMIYLG